MRRLGTDEPLSQAVAPRDLRSALAQVEIQLVTFLVFGVYQVMIVLLPFYAARAGYAEVAAGSFTASFMVPATVGPLLVPRLATSPGMRSALGWGIAFLVVGTALLGFVHGLALLLAVNALRGFSFGIVVAMLPAVVASATRTGGERERALGWWGLACTVPAIFSPAVAVAVVRHDHMAASAWIGAAVLVLALAPLLADPSRRVWPGPQPAAGLKLRPADLRARGLPAASVVFLWASVTYGAVVSFMAVLLTGHGHAAVTSVGFLVAMGAAIPVGRLAGGIAVGPVTRYALPVSTLLAAAGILAVLITSAGAVRIVAGVVYGAAWGLAGTVSQVVLISRLGPDRPAFGSAWFSVLFNFGIAVGGLGGGLVTQFGSLHMTFGLCAALSLLTAPAALSVARSIRA